MGHTQETDNISRQLLSVSVFLMVLSLLFEGWFAYIDLGPFPPRNYSIPIVFALVVVYFLYQGTITLDAFFIAISGVLITMILWVATVDVWAGISAYTRFHRLGLFAISFFALNVTYVSARDERVFRIYLWSVFLVIGTSSFVAAMQLLGVDLFWDLRLLFGTSSEAIESQLVNQTRPAGLSLFAIQLSYQLSMLVPLSFGLAYTGFAWRSWEHKLLLSVVLVMATGLIATKTRSAIIGAVVGCLLIILLDGDGWLKRLKKLIPVTVVAVLGLLAVPSVHDRFVDIGGSAYSRLPMTVLALLVAWDNPLGVGTGQYDPMPYAEYVRHYQGVHIALNNSPHNQFLNTLVYYGLPGLLLLLALYLLVFKKLFALSIQDNGLNTNRVAIALLGGFAGYVINSLFHNAGAFVADPFHWYFIGLTCALVHHSTTCGDI